MVKPARSKHCELCGFCVEKFDRHSMWINNCVGAKNQKYYLIMILMQTVLVMYAVVISGLIFYGQM
jgi:hypothetical protein